MPEINIMSLMSLKCRFISTHSKFIQLIIRRMLRMTINTLGECAEREHSWRKRIMKWSFFGKCGEFAVVGLTKTCRQSMAVVTFLHKLKSAQLTYRPKRQPYSFSVPSPHGLFKILEQSQTLKILSSQKRGGSRGVPFDSSWSPTPSQIFFRHT